MWTPSTLALVGAFWLAPMLAVWVLLVPVQLSIGNWLWLNAGVVAVAVTAAGLRRRLIPTPTIAEILQDVERQGRV